MSIKVILIFLLKFYLLSVAACLLMEMLTTARSQYYGIPLREHALAMTIGVSIVPGGNLIVAFDNFVMLFAKREKFILRFMFTRDRMDEVKFINKEEEEDDR